MAVSAFPSNGSLPASMDYRIVKLRKTVKELKRGNEPKNPGSS